jgi:hypothetical protein
MDLLICVLSPLPRTTKQQDFSGWVVRSLTIVDTVDADGALFICVRCAPCVDWTGESEIHKLCIAIGRH